MTRRGRHRRRRRRPWSAGAVDRPAASHFAASPPSTAALVSSVSGVVVISRRPDAATSPARIPAGGDHPQDLAGSTSRRAPAHDPRPGHDLDEEPVDVVAVGEQQRVGAQDDHVGVAGWPGRGRGSRGRSGKLGRGGAPRSWAPRPRRWAPAACHLASIHGSDLPSRNRRAETEAFNQRPHVTTYPGDDTFRLATMPPPGRARPRRVRAQAQ